MHYFKFNIGDYSSHTQHLTLIEDMAYRRLLEIYYLQERPLNSGIATVSRQIRMREHEDAVGLVLQEFFKLCDEGWRNPRADREIAEYHAKIEQASNAGKASAASRLNGRSTDVQLNTKQETLNKKQETTTPIPPEGFVVFWDKYPKKVGKPAAMRAFKTAKLNGDLSTVLADIDRRVSDEAWRKDGGQFIPHPATYLNQRRWEDGAPDSDIFAGAI